MICPICQYDNVYIEKEIECRACGAIYDKEGLVMEGAGKKWYPIIDAKPREEHIK